VLGRHAAPADRADRTPGDLVLTPEGGVVVADSTAGDLLVLDPGGAALRVLTPSGTLGSPQGLVVTPDGAALIVADYSSGLWRVDRATGDAERLAAPANASLIGVDGLTREGDTLYAFQNGVAPQRVLRITPDAGWRRIVGVETVAANLPLLDEPTTGLVRNGELVFVSRSQWSDFDGEGALRTPRPDPAIIARLRLD
jgi:sugar lactone lactonase YvrE